ncbi:MSC_0624 family F1-like ATPase-associated membrane protein [[Mycoplasma] anseris]|uniref:Transmembrane protein n=1 Tax=[Mycoplasma] anseris TaxID=92400 RepID=A0A2Z4NCU2_9BACT|nr:hypothetical protein [[Mycoplasma] anseris]AWX69391.1 hypothetical protein DP065_01315 [[Mycoplasma] anseris]
MESNTKKQKPYKQIYEYLVFVLSFVFILTLLFSSNQLVGDNYFKNYFTSNPKHFGSEYVFDFTTNGYKSINFVILTNYIVFATTLIVSLYLGFRNIKRNIIKSIYYLPWLIGYLTIALITLIVNLVWIDLSPISIFKKSFIFIALLFFNNLFNIFNVIKAKKIQAINKQKLRAFIIKIIFEIVLISSLMAIFWLFIKDNQTNPENLFQLNSFGFQLQKTINSRSFVSFISILGICIFSLIWIISSIIFNFNFKQIKTELKNHLNFVVPIYLATFIYMIIKVFLINYEHSILIGIKITNLNYLPFVMSLLVNILISIGFGLFLYLKINKQNKNLNITNFVYSIVNISILINGTILRIYNLDNLNNTMAILFSVSFIFISYLLIHYSNKTIQRSSYLVLILISVSLMIMGLFQIFEVSLLAHQNTSLEGIPTPYKIVDILAIANIAIIIMNLIYNVSKWLKSSIIIFKNKKKLQEEGNYEMQTK